MNIDYEMTLLRQTRANIAGIIKSLPLEKLTEIPRGFRNHLFWNAAHVLATQQLLCYKMAGMPLSLDQLFIDRYRKGSVPQPGDVTADLQVFEANAQTLVDRLESDYAAGRFGDFKSYPTSYGVTLNSVDDAIRFNNVHEGVHLGYMLAMRRLI